MFCCLFFVFQFLFDDGVGWGGMLTFMLCYADDVTLIMGWGGVGC